jgi:hypothetical protein
MGTTLSTISRYLDQRKWRYQISREHQCIITGVKAKHIERFSIVIRVSENGGYVQFQAPTLLTLRDHVYKGVVFQTLCHIAYQYKLLRLEYDPADGEIRASIEVPLEDAVLTKRQFDRCLDGLVQLVDDVALPRIQAVLATGQDPGQRAAAQQFLEQLPPGMVSLLEDMIDQRRRDGN